MALKPVGKASPLKQGLSFAAVTFAITFTYAWMKVGGINLAVFVSSFVGALVGGLVYGFIGWLRYKN